MTNFTIAGLQLDLQARQNLDLFSQKVRSTVKRYPFVQMIVTSELAICGAGVGYASPTLDEVEPVLCELARELNIWLIPGSLYERQSDLTYNTAPVINPAGEVISRFRKICPFLPYEKNVEGGADICCFDVPDVGRFGLYICYDMWFPELSRAMILDGAEVIIHPTLTDTCDRSVEKSMCRATAAQQQCYMVDINGTGALGVGQSIIVGPEGDVIHEASTGEEVILFEADLTRVRRTRERGILNLGQPLKSYRDTVMDKAQYQPSDKHSFLSTLGPLSIPTKAG
jgi:predicted amidohydrolase